MQLAYSIWNEIERRVLAKKGCSNESIQAYKQLLNLTAKKLPRTQVKKILQKMNGNLAATVALKGRRSTAAGGDD